MNAHAEQRLGPDGLKAAGQGKRTRSIHFPGTSIKDFRFLRVVTLPYGRVSVRGRSVNESDWAYNKGRDGGNRNAWAKLPQRLAEADRRLKRVQVGNLPFEDVMRRYDPHDTLFLLDPGSMTLPAASAPYADTA